MKKILILIVFLSLLFHSTAASQSKTVKLKRGLINIFTGWIEIPKNIYDTCVEDGKFIGLTKGTVSGIGAAIVRTSAGIYETITFPIEVPSKYEPIMQPEFIIEKERGVNPSWSGPSLEN